MEIDCSDYHSERCKKETRLNIPRENLRDMIILACWGVYCQSGSRIQYKKIKDSKEPKNEIKKYEPKQIELGQTYVFNGIYSNVKDDSVSDIFFAGDNVYRYSYPLDHIDQEEKQLLMGFEMDKQLESFENCYKEIKPHVSRTFIAIGNHDIETCDILNQQLNYGGWEQTGVYYTVRYHNDHVPEEEKVKRGVTIIVLDTNMYDEKLRRCDKNKFTEDDIKKQEDFVVEECKLAKENEDWIIIIGHIPAIATGHSDKKKNPIENERLLSLITNCHPHLYVCGDEHNQQFIYNNGISFAVVGSGGTDLDTLLQQKMHKTLYAQKKFGFLRLSFENNHLTLIFKVSHDNNNTEDACTIPINYDGKIDEASIRCI